MASCQPAAAEMVPLKVMFLQAELGCNKTFLNKRGLGKTKLQMVE
jgi:hypothetical protein